MNKNIERILKNKWARKKNEGTSSAMKVICNEPLFQSSCPPGPGPGQFEILAWINSIPMTCVKTPDFDIYDDTDFIFNYCSNSFPYGDYMTPDYEKKVIRYSHAYEENYYKSLDPEKLAILKGYFRFMKNKIKKTEIIYTKQIDETFCTYYLHHL
ncbi:hypothetical protein ACFLR5_02205 [Elusimicrobiota bacterium]